MLFAALWRKAGSDRAFPDTIHSSDWAVSRTQEAGVNDVCRSGLKQTKQMEYNNYKTVSVSKEAARDLKRWVVIDAKDQILGRMCTKVANLLRGKYKPQFTPNVDCGDNVIIINADQVRMTGNKWTDRVYVRYTGFPGGQREFTPEDLKNKGIDKLIRKVVKGMLPKNRLGDKLIGNLYVFGGAEHDKQAQQPIVIDINTLK